MKIEKTAPDICRRNISTCAEFCCLIQLWITSKTRHVTSNLCKTNWETLSYPWPKYTENQGFDETNNSAFLTATSILVILNILSKDKENAVHLKKDF